MEVDDKEQADAIAAEWGVDAALLEAADWNIESIEGNDGELYGYTVRFADDTSPEVLAQLGVLQGGLARSLSINAFDEPESDEPRIGRSVNEATFSDFSFAGNTFAVEDDARHVVDHGGTDDDPEDDDDPDDGTYSVDEPFPGKLSFTGRDMELEEPADRKNGGRAYYIDDQRFTPSQFRRLSRRRKVEAMVAWFHENYEDPAMRTPYESREGGYQWIWGGPYDAQEEIGDQFSDIADEESMEEAVDEVTSDGLLEWAPTPSRDDYDQDDASEYVSNPDSLMGLIRSSPADDGIYSLDEPLPDLSQLVEDDEGGASIPDLPIGQSYIIDDNSNFRTDGDGRFLVSDVDEDELRQKIEINLGDVDKAVTDLRDLARRTHNNPPELIEILPPVDVIFEVVTGASQALRIELALPSPNIGNTRRQLSILNNFSRVLRVALGVVTTGVVGNVATDALKGDYTIPLSLYLSLQKVVEGGQALLKIIALAH